MTRTTLALCFCLAFTSCASPGGMLGTNADEFVTVTKPDGTRIMWGRNIDNSTFGADLVTGIVAGLGIHGRVKIQGAEQETLRQTAETATRVPIVESNNAVRTARIGANESVQLKALDE